MANEVKIMNKTSSSVEIDVISDFYVITFKDLHDDYKMYIGELENIEGFTYDMHSVENENNIGDLKTEIAFYYRNRCDDNRWESDLGEIDSVVSLKDLIMTYSVIKNEYTYDDINEIVEKYRNDYIQLMKKENVKKFNLKYVEK